MDMIGMDDGWFGKRDDDNSGLGDWYVNEEKLGESLESLISRINALGIKFGIWFEPEAVNEDSDLYRTHPDWAFAAPGRHPVRGRNMRFPEMRHPGCRHKTLQGKACPQTLRWFCFYAILFQ